MKKFLFSILVLVLIIAGLYGVYIFHTNAIESAKEEGVRQGWKECDMLWDPVSDMLVEELMKPTPASITCVCDCDPAGIATEKSLEPTPPEPQHCGIETKIVRMTVVNYSEYDVYMKLEGSEVTCAFYYLAIPAGTRDEPTVKVFTVMVDLYTRTTWECNGDRDTGTLIVDGNIDLTFSPCGETPVATWEPRG